MRPHAELTMAEWVRALAAPKPLPAGGALGLVTLAGTAALSAKLARLHGVAAEDFDRWAARFLEAADEDVASYGGASRDAAAREACLARQVEHLRLAVRFLEALPAFGADLKDPVLADLAACERAARASARTLLVNLAVNLSAWSDAADGLEAYAGELERFERRLEER